MEVCAQFLLEAVLCIWWQNLGLFSGPLRGAQLKSKVHRLQEGRGLIETIAVDY